MTKYIEIDGERHDLDKEYQLRTPSGVWIDTEDLEFLGIEVKDDTSWDIVNQTGTHLDLGNFIGMDTDEPSDYATGVQFLVAYAERFPRETFELHKGAEVVATLKGEQA